MTETTALGAAYAAGLAVGYWEDQDELKERWAEDKRWEPEMDDDEREKGYARWKKAVERSLDWEDVGAHRSTSPSSAAQAIVRRNVSSTGV